MRNDELYISNEYVDLDDNTKITLKYKSNLFTDISKIVSNSSYTIKLPNTIKNQSIIFHADLPTCDIPFPRFKYDARYFRNGVEILKDAKIILLSTSDVFEFVLSWGNTSRFEPIVKEGKTLNDLKERSEYENVSSYNFPDYCINWIRQERSISSYPVLSDFFIPRLNYNFRSSDETAWYHPAVKAKWILDHIAMDNDVTFIIPENRMERLNEMFIPLLTRNDNKQYANSKDLYLKFEYYSNTDPNSGKPIDLYFENKDFSSYYGAVTQITISNKEYVGGFHLNAPNMKLILSGEVKVTCVKHSYPNDARLIAYTLKDGSVNEIVSISYTDIEEKGNDDYYINFVFEDVHTQVVEESTDVMFALMGAGWIGSPGFISIRNVMIIVAICDEVMPSLNANITNGTGHYPIIPNLPTIKQIDYIKTIAAMLGLFAIPVEDSDNVIQFVSVDDIVANEVNAYDWTHKVVASYRTNKPKKLNYTLPDFAQKNYLKYKDDSTVKGNYNGYIQVIDATISEMRDMLTIPFAGTDMAGGTASIRLYSYDSDGKSSLEKVEPRILLIENNSGEAKGVFTGLDFQHIIDNFYSNYKDVVMMPKVITEKIEISDIELKSLDMTRPVYLAQYGRFYAIVDVKAEDTGICECELLQL